MVMSKVAALKNRNDNNNDYNKEIQMVRWVIKPASFTRPGSRLNPKQKISSSAFAGNDPETKINLAPYVKQVSLKNVWEFWLAIKRCQFYDSSHHLYLFIIIIIIVIKNMIQDAVGAYIWTSL